MKNHSEFRLPDTLFVSSWVSENEIIEASKQVKDFLREEMDNLREKSKLLSFAGERNKTYSEFFNLIPSILINNNLSIQKFSKHCRSCIITEEEVYGIAEYIHDNWKEELLEKFSDKEIIEEKYSDFEPFERIPRSKQKLYFEFVYIIPIAFKKSGYEIIRKSEAGFINLSIAEKLARVIHSKYLKSMNSLKGDSVNIYKEMYFYGENSSQFITDFDSLDEDIKLSNIDNAYHVPTKLLSIGYIIQDRFDTDIETPLLTLNEFEIETMARIEHDRWCWERRLSGWTYSEIRDNNRKLHNCLVPYDELPEEEKEKDRILVRLIPYLLKDIGFALTPVSPELSENIAYVKKDWGCISELTSSVIRLKSIMTEEMAEKAKDDLVSIEFSIDNIKSAFKSGKRVQNCFLPSILEFKEYLPDSFVLYKPKDIVSGDFFFIEKLNNTVVLSAADCTGHGISASILTAICYSFLDTAIRKKKITDPAKILKYVIPRVEEFLKQDIHGDSNKFGMDFTVCALDLEKNTLSFSGFGNPVYYYSNGELKIGKGILSLYSYGQAKKMIKTTSIQLAKGDTFYLFSDGFADQEKESGKKFQQHRFQTLLSGIQPLTLNDQCEKLNQTIEEWRRSVDIHQPQTDDILIIGVKI
ncbi:MAG: SpoIIE family protein phosphatase [Bacteroidales bacterium]|nr:MAG: SpoIIE family protein phosphatase [Bacteroidales bacterium]